MKNILKNWKTTSTGIALVVTGIVTMVNSKTYVGESLTGILAGIGLILSADSSTTPDTTK